MGHGFHSELKKGPEASVMEGSGVACGNSIDIQNRATLGLPWDHDILLLWDVYLWPTVDLDFWD